jgi:hypothetical protein
MRSLALFLLLSAAGAQAQEGTPAPLPSAAQPAAAEKTVDQTASPELVGQLVKELGITPNQAQGAAGTMFGVAKSKLSAPDFAKVAGAVPNMDGLLAAAPAPTADATSAVAALAGKAGGVASMAGAAATLSKLGLKAETVAKVAPVLVKAVESKGGAEVGALLAGALK